MALPCLHKDITVRVMDELGFAAAALEAAGNANAAVDQKQGNTADQANLHAMRGFVEPNPLVRYFQTEDECRESVARWLEVQNHEVASTVLRGNRRAAVRRLGEALHTVQDRIFHNFEPWPYRGIAEAFEADAAYMICHALRDVALFSRLELSHIHEGRFDLEITGRLGGRWFLSQRFFNHPVSSDRPPGPIGRDPLGAGGFLGAGFLISVTFGAAPGSLPEPEPLGPPPRHPTGQSPYWSFVTQGPSALARAEDATRDFIQEVRSEVELGADGRGKWDQLLHFLPDEPQTVGSPSAAAD